MSDLIIEVDEALKQERLEKLWQRYGGFFIGFLAMIILGTAANAGYSAWVQNRNFKQTNLYLDEISKKDISVENLLKITPDVTAEMSPLVKLRAAGIAIENKDLPTAISIYQEIEKSDTADNMVKSLAKYMTTNLDQSLTIEQKRSRYNEIIADQKSPWRYHALMDAALMEANIANDYTKARQYLAQITGASLVAQSLKKKAQSLDILYSAKGSTPQ